MYCRNCGNKLPEGARFCGACGAEQKQSMVNADEKQPETVYQGMTGKTVEKQDVISNDSKIKSVKCPKCGGKRLQIMTETDTHVKTSGGGYSATKGCLGWLIFGPFGLLCGNCGSKQKTSVDTTNKTYWVCSDCGNKFRNLDDWKKEIEEKEKLANNTMIYCVLAFIAAFICFAIRFSFLAWIMLILGIVYVILIPVGKNQLNQEKEEYKKLEYESTEK